MLNTFLKLRDGQQNLATVMSLFIVVCLLLLFWSFQQKIMQMNIMSEI